MTLFHENCFHTTGPLWGESTFCPVDSPHKGASYVEIWCFFVDGFNELFDKQNY